MLLLLRFNTWKKNEQGDFYPYTQQPVGKAGDNYAVE
jgi:hypothetical protein